MIGGIAVMLGGIYLWMHGYQNSWVIAMIVFGILSAVSDD